MEDEFYGSEEFFDMARELSDSTKIERALLVIRQACRNILSQKLMDTSPSNQLECYIYLDNCENTQGLSDSYRTIAKSMYQEPCGGEIAFVTDTEEIDPDDLSTDTLVDIVSQLPNK